MNRQCISRESCEQENSKHWEDSKFVPSNGSCHLRKYCDSIKINEKSDFSQLSGFRECQVVTKFVEIEFSRNFCKDLPKMTAAIAVLSEIIEIHGHLKITNLPLGIKNLQFMTKLKMVEGYNLKSGINSLNFDPKEGWVYYKTESPNNTFSNEAFCTNNCDNKTLELEITPKTNGFVVKILNNDLKKFLDDNVKLTSFVLNSNEYYGREICGSVPMPTQYVKFWLY